MPELIWKGKDKVINHHQVVPVRTLDHQYAFGGSREGESGNKIIHGDNLEALKALLPRYEGKIKCIYIDPPYNTGNEGWVYNDNVNDPRIKKWLGEVVGKEGEDLCRHDKWLCMMYPRLQLLKRLLADDGSIFISIDDNELATLRLVCDEIFGRNNFVANFVWEKRKNRENRKAISTRHDHLICYAKKYDLFVNGINQLPMDDAALARYKNPDNDQRGLWKSDPATAQSGHGTNSQFYELVAPNGKVHKLPRGRCWVYTENVMQQSIIDKRIWFGASGNNVPRIKTFLNQKDRGLTPETILFAQDVSTTEEAKNSLKEIFYGEVPFETPKPTKLVQRILQIATDKGAIILDSFAGSGTTAHAVLNLNEQDGGNRKFILIEMMDYAETITAERVRRVINGYGEENRRVEGTGGGFDYYTLGDRVFDDEGNLNEAVGTAKIRQYVAWTEKLPAIEPNEHPYWLGERDRTGFYFHYEPDRLTVLNLDFLKTIQRKNDSYLIYADTCLLDESFMRKHGIRFKKIPRDISRF